MNIKKAERISTTVGPDIVEGRDRRTRFKDQRSVLGASSP